MRRKRKAARAAGSAVPPPARKALAGKLKRAAESLKAKTPIAKRTKKTPQPIKKIAKKTTRKAKPKDRAVKDRAEGAKVVGRIIPKVKAKAPPPGSSGPVNPGDMVRAALSHAADIVLSDGPFTLHDSKQVIGIVRDALETIAVVDSHRPPAQVEAELSQFNQVALDFIPQKRRADFIVAFEKALKAAT